MITSGLRYVSVLGAASLVVGLLTASAIPQTASATSPTLTTVGDGPNAQVDDIATTPDDTTYLVGAFDSWGPATGGAAATDAATGEVNRQFPPIDGTITASAPDGDGGFYLAGTFTHVGGVPRAGLAYVAVHPVDDSYVLTDWAPEVDGTVHAMARMADDSWVILGGDFDLVNGRPIENLAAVDKVTGTTTSDTLDFPFGAGDSVRAVVAEGTAVYFGGRVTSFDGPPAQGGGLVDNFEAGTDDWAAMDWDPGVSVGGSSGGVIHTMHFESPDVLYVGGNFNRVSEDDTPCTGLVRFSTTGDRLVDPTWLPALDFGAGSQEGVYDIEWDSTAVLVGGEFRADLGGGNEVFGLVSVDANDPAMLTDVGSIPQSSRVAGLELAVDDTLYAVGRFETAFDASGGSESRRNAAAFETATGDITGWDPQLEVTRTSAGDNVGLFVGLSDLDDIVVAGDFTVVHGRDAPGIVQLDPAGEATSWEPTLAWTCPPGQPNCPVWNRAVVATDDSVYIATNAWAGAPCDDSVGLLALDAATATPPTTWCNNVPTLPLDGGNSPIRDMLLVDDSLYVAGDFDLDILSDLARLDASTGVLDDSWTPSTSSSSWVNTMAYDATGQRMIIGGLFNTVLGQPRLNAAAIAVTPLATLGAWSPDPTGADDSEVFALALADDSVFIGGNFTQVDGAAAPYLARVDSVTGDLDTQWSPGVSGMVTALTVDAQGTVYAAGSFSQAGGVPRRLLASWAANGQLTDLSLDVQESYDAFGSPATSLSYDATRDRISFGGRLTVPPAGVLPRSVPGALFFDVDAPPGAFTADTPPATGTVGAVYAGYSFVAPGSGVRYVTGAGSLPPGLSLNASTGALTGTPTTAGNFTFAVRSVNKWGSTDATPSTITVASTPTPPPTPTDPPGPPTQVLAVAGDGRANVTWTPPAASGTSPVSTYQVSSTPAGASCMVAVPARSCDVSGLVNGTTYTFRVRALSAAGWGSYSAESNAVTPLAPPAASIVIAGSREGAGRRIIAITGLTTGMRGEIVTPHVRLKGQTSFIVGRVTSKVAEDGTFTWQRRVSKKAFVYFTHGKTRSNTVVIAAR